jgi:peptidoglycan/xylan/chitin deacetylase (PgdA/CDA1 family)
MTHPLPRTPDDSAPDQRVSSRSLAWLVPTPTTPGHFLTIELGETGTSHGGVDGTVGYALDALDRSDAKGTFFVSAAVAGATSDLVREIHRRGHEVAARSPESALERDDIEGFRQDVWATKAAIEDAIGERVRGHRTRASSLRRGREWAFDILVESGYEYDSSRRPHRRHALDLLDSPAGVYALHRWSGTLVEVPQTAVQIFGKSVPLTAEWLRTVPLPALRSFVRHRDQRHEPVVLSVAASDFDPAAHTPADGFLRRLRRASSHDALVAALDRTLRAFQFTSIVSQLPELRRVAVIYEC